MSLQDMESSGELAREDLTSGEVARHLESIRERLQAANFEGNPNRTRLEQAYYAILNCARIALRVDGYRITSSRRHHQIALETLIEAMGTDNADIDYFHSLSGERHNDIYDAAPVTDSDVSDAIEAATKLAEKLHAWLEVRVPEEL
jgi:uncharacterized protein (UPF0332 family)